jgi:hypothetical protein
MSATPSVLSATPVLRAAAGFSAAVVAGSLHADTFSDSHSPIQVVGAGPGFSAPQQRLTLVPFGQAPRPQANPSARSAAAANAAGLAPAPGRPSADAVAEARPPVVTADAQSAIQYVFYCFGPVFGNDGRSVDPNFIPPPTAHDGSSNRPTITPVIYRRVDEQASPVTTWLGEDGSSISYRPRNSTESQAAPANANREVERPSVEEIIAENRRELAKLSWTRAFQRYPELERDGSPEREAFEPYLARRRAESRDIDLAENPMWPEMIVSEFMESWRWRQAESDSWERARARAPFLNDGQHPETRRFLEFTAGLRANSDDARIFQQPTWPERALDLQRERAGAPPMQ